VYPILFRFGVLSVPTYGAVLALGLLIAITFSQRTARLAGIDADKLWNFEVTVLFAAILTRQGVLLFGWTEWVASLAALLVAAIAALLMLRGARLMQLRTLDALAPAVAVAMAARALACFAAGCAYGTPTTLPWGVEFSSRQAWILNGTTLGVPLHPVQLYSAAMQLILAAVLYYWLQHSRQRGEVAGAWLLGTGFSATMIEQLRAPATILWLPGKWLSATQLIYAAMIVLGAVLLWQRPHASRQND
jgi:phosphatidylglycerol:prolipoprotein diacylglycerol transferase